MQFASEGGLQISAVTSLARWPACLQLALEMSFDPTSVVPDTYLPAKNSTSNPNICSLYREIREFYLFNDPG